MLKIRKGSKSYALLKHLATGSGVIIISLLSPPTGAKLLQIGLAGYFRKRRFERYRLRRDLKKLQDRSLVSWREHTDGRIEIKLARRGEEVMLVHKLDSLALPRPKHWDNKWRLITFDIPHSCKRARDAFRRKLRDLNFHPLHKSVFLTPFPCEDEIDFLAAVLDVRPHVLILEVCHFEGEAKLKRHFNL
ncbi:MAG: hypothetical protein HY978_02370 [Candidatus Liptonbacteria bacterium]|nr:hypothetical protein [Candidatus Liptonbacteria bacterium]